VQAELWCQRAARGRGREEAVNNLPIIRQCDFCGSTPARQHCKRCPKVRYSDRRCQLGHWNRETDPHKEHCRRAAETSHQEDEAVGASTPAK
jgi:hypothetical protein